MSGVIVNYNNNALTSMSSSGTKTLLTSGKYCEGDFEVVYDGSNTYTATIMDDGNSNYCYVTYNGTKYYSNSATFSFKAGDTLTIYCRGNDLQINGEFITLSNYSYTYTLPVGDIDVYLYYSASTSNQVIINGFVKPDGDLNITGDGFWNVYGYYWASVPTGTAATPAKTIVTNPIIGVNASGVVTASYNGSSSISPTITSGYVTTGTAGTVSTSGTSTYQLTSKAAATYNTSTADQTIASQRWLTGTQTIKSVTTSNLTAENIAEGVVVTVGDANNASRIAQITGTHSGGIQHTCTITGQGFNGCCIKYNGQDYTTAGTFTFKTGDKIRIHASGSQYGYNVSIKINGQNMPNTNYSYNEDYIMPDCDVNILLEYNSESEWKHIYITTPQIDINANGIYDVVNYGMASVNVNVAGGFTADEIAMRTISGDISGNATSIGSYAFYYCHSLTTASFPNCTNIRGYAFYACYSLTTANFPNCTNIGSYAFYSCSALSTVNFPNCINISSYAFYYCSTLSTASFPNCTSIGGYAFYGCYSLSTASFPSTTTIGNSAFRNCYSLTTANFPNCTNNGSYAFYACRTLSITSFPSATTIGSSAFYACYSLSTASFPNCTSIGSCAFYACSALSTASFPNVIGITNSAFIFCYNLLSFYLLGSSVPTLGTSVFYSTPIDSNTTSTGGVYGSIFVPSSLYDQYIVATNWSLYSARIVSV